MTKYLVFTNSFNAAAIARGLALVGRKLESTVPWPGLVPSAARQPRAGDTLFFTEERSLKLFYGDDRYCMWPCSGQLIVDDKLRFSEWLRDRREQPAPFSATLDSAAVFPVVLKARHSWLGEQQLPRGYICRSSQELASELHKLERQGLPRGAFFLQKYLLGASGFSTCGFFDHRDPRRNAVLVTRRVLATGSGLQSSAIVETTADPGELLARTESILAAMHYTGPFELEFLHARDGQLYILELNPRFWLQHGMFIDFFDNVLLRRYIDENDRSPFAGHDAGMQPIAWLNTWYFLHSLLRGDTAVFAAYAAKLRQYRRGRIRARWYPSPRQALSWLAQTPYRRLARALVDRLRRIDNRQLRRAVDAA